MRRKVRRIKKASIETLKDKNIHAVLISLFLGFLLGFVSFYFKLDSSTTTKVLSVVIALLFSSIVKKVLVRVMSIDQKGWAFSHVYWPLIISWFATWTFLLNV